MKKIDISFTEFEVFINNQIFRDEIELLEYLQTIDYEQARFILSVLRKSLEPKWLYEVTTSSKND